MKVLSLIILALFLTGCSAFEQQIDYKYKELYKKTDGQLCCILDPEFPHSCDGWLLCENL